jgi:hypothetical protein
MDFNFKLRIRKPRIPSSQYVVDIQFATWGDPDVWITFRSFKTKKRAKVFVATAILMGTPFEVELTQRLNGKRISANER